MMNYYPAPENAILRLVGVNDLVKELGITEEEASLLGSKVSFDFWWKGEDLDSAKKWTLDGDDVYSEFNFKDFLLAMICEFVCGAHRSGRPELAEEIKAIEALHEYIHFAKNRVTIKARYYGIYKNGWMF